MEMTVNGCSYEVLALLGKGGYSYRMRCQGQEYTLKQIHYELCEYYQFGDKLAAELGDYEKLRAVGISMPELLEVDRQQERAMCAKLYPAGLNIDYYPTNFILHEGTLYYIDYECNPYDPKWDFENWGAKYWKRHETDPHAFSIITAGLDRRCPAQT